MSACTSVRFASTSADVIGTISSKIPEGTRNHDVTQLEVSDERVQLQGIAAAVQDRDRIVDALKTYECFPTVTPGRTQTNPPDNRQQYKLEIEFRCPGRASSTRRPGASGSTNTTGSSSTSGSSSAGGSSGSN